MTIRSLDTKYKIKNNAHRSHRKNMLNLIFQNKALTKHTNVLIAFDARTPLVYVCALDATTLLTRTSYIHLYLITTI